jgi:hypothetical protein
VTQQVRRADLCVKVILLIKENGTQIIGFPRAFAPHDNGGSLMEVLIDPIVPLEQPVHHLGVFGIDIDRIDWAERLIFCNVRAKCIEQ